jgi:hypothetical protein
VRPEAAGRAPFELRRFTAAAVNADVAVVELEGRFTGTRGRFGRRPVLVVEAPGEPRAELAPARTRLDGERWHGTFAAPLAALEAGTFALGVGGVLFDLPRPDGVAGADRLTIVAREANALRRQVEALEAERDAAVADAARARAELEDAVGAAREEVAAASAERISDLEEEIVAAHRVAETDANSARAAAEAARRDAVAAVEQQLAHERERAEVAEARAAAAEERERVVGQGAEVLRAELAEERERAKAAIADLQASLDEAIAAAADVPAESPPPPPSPPAAEADRAREPEPIRAFELELDPETTVARRPGGDAADEDDDDSRPIPLRRETAVRPQHVSPVEPAPQHGPGLSPWLAVLALGVFAFLVVALILGVLH